VPVATLAAELHRPTGYVVLAASSPVDGADDLDGRLPGISLIADSLGGAERNLAAPVVGFTNAAGKGGGGLSTGTTLCWPVSTQETIMQSPAGVTLPQSRSRSRWPRVRAPAWSSPSTHNCSTSPSSTGQVDRELECHQRTAVVMDVKTGQISPWRTSSPPIRQRSCRRLPPPVRPRGVVPIGPNDAINEAPSNLAVTQLYEPGSVFKLVTFSAALQDGLINPNSVFTCPTR